MKKEVEKKVEKEVEKKTPKKKTKEQLKKDLTKLKIEFMQVQIEYKQKIISLTRQINKKV